MTVEQNAGGLAALAATLDEPVDRRALLRAELDAWTEPTDDVAPTREISQDLRAELDPWAGPAGEVAPTRENIRRLLKALKRHLGDVLDPQKPMEGGRTLVTPHWASSLLETMIDGLADLDRGKTPPLLKVTPGGSGAALTAEERKFDDALVEAIAIVKQANSDPTYRGLFRLGDDQTAEEFIARKLDAAGVTRRGDAYTKRNLGELNRNIKRRKPLPE